SSETPTARSSTSCRTSSDARRRGRRRPPTNLTEGGGLGCCCDRPLRAQVSGDWRLVLSCARVARTCREGAGTRAVSPDRDRFPTRPVSAVSRPLDGSFAVQPLGVSRFVGQNGQETKPTV